MEKLNLLPNNTDKLHLHSRGHVEALARHLFKNDPIGLAKVDREFGEHKVIPREIKVPAAKDYTYHHIPQ